MNRPLFLNSLLVIIMSMIPKAYANDLYTIYQQALAYDAELAQANAERRAVYFDKIAARGALLPQMNVRYSTSNVETELAGNPLANSQQRVDASYDLTSLEFTASTALWDLSSWYKFQVAVSSDEQAEYQLTLAEQDLMLRVSDGYFDYLRAQRQLQTAVNQTEAVERSLELAQQRFIAGAGNQADVEEAKARFDSARVNQLNQQVAVQIAEEAIMSLTGQAVPQLADLQPEMQTVKLLPSRVDQWVELGLARSAVLAAARSQQKQQKMQRNSVFAKVSPNVQLFANYSDSSQPPFTASTDTADVTSQQIGISVTMPLLAGGNLYGSARASTKRLVAAEQNVLQQERQIQQDIRSLFYRVTTDSETIRARGQSVISASTALTAVEQGYQAGARNIVELFDAQTVVFQAERDYDIARYDYVLNLLRLKARAGVLVSDDLQQINTWLEQ